jgi:hypothetical protein
MSGYHSFQRASADKRQRNGRSQAAAPKQNLLRSDRVRIRFIHHPQGPESSNFARVEAPPLSLTRQAFVTRSPFRRQLRFWRERTSLHRSRGTRPTRSPELSLRHNVSRHIIHFGVCERRCASGGKNGKLSSARDKGTSKKKPNTSVVEWKWIASTELKLSSGDWTNGPGRLPFSS